MAATCKDSLLNVLGRGSALVSASLDAGSQTGAQRLASQHVQTVSLQDCSSGCSLGKLSVALRCAPCGLQPKMRKTNPQSQQEPGERPRPGTAHGR